MRKRDLKRALAGAFPAPEPVRRRDFLRAMPPAPVGHLRLTLGQAGYIRPLTWAASVGIFALALALGRLFPADAVWAAAALTPFAAMTAAAESGRSALHGMEELELASRFGLRSVALARMGAVGLAHLILLALLAAACGGSFFRTGVYILTPYLAADLLGLAAVRRLRGREGLYAAAGAAALTAGLCVGLHSARAYAPANFRWWLLALVMAAALTGREHLKTLHEKEELSWNWC